ncbi:MAG: cytochrome c3 family protein [candidate division NC10 bacterium]|nr:cytochrome c3 family protein [candidate division NC10 bacterium]
MMRTVRMIGLLLFALAVSVLLLGSRPEAAGEQPIAFNHKAHVSKGLDCAICHRYVREQAFATLPTLQTCLMCHSAKMSDNPEEAKIREFAKRGEPLRWVRLYTLAPDAAAYFSHRRHVALGNIPCATCHGPMAEQTTPPAGGSRDAPAGGLTCGA